MRNYRTGANIITIFAILLIVFVIGIIILGIILPFVTQDTIIATVTGKEMYTTISCSDDNGCSSNTHLTIYTDKEVIEISDCLVLWKFGEQQKYGKIKDGKTYQFKVWGFNIPMLQMYRSAYEYSEIL
jgi:hypothetical protein